MSNVLLDTLGQVGYALDTPGAYLRGALAGRPGDRASGEELLSSYGVDGGPLGGLAAEMVVDPLTLLPPVWGAYKGLQGVTKGARALGGAMSPLSRLAEEAVESPLTRRLGELAGPSPLDRRLGELGGLADPMDRLRAGYRNTAGAAGPDPLTRAMGLFGDETATLDMDVLGGMFGGNSRAANVAAVQGPDYPGGADKVADMLRGKVGAGISGSLLDDPSGAKYIASEIPEGSSFLGKGAHGVAFATPHNSVIRVSQRAGDRPVKRYEIAEMLQPFRSVYKGGHTIEHLPRVRPLDGLIDEDLRLDDVGSAFRRGGGDIRALYPLIDDRNALQDAAFKEQRRVLAALSHRGFEDHDWDFKNIGLTAQGNLLAHDPGVFATTFANRNAPTAPILSTAEGVPFRNAVRARSGAVGARDYIRDVLERDAAIGDWGQGVPVPGIDAVRPQMDRLTEFLSRFPGGRLEPADVRAIMSQFRGG